MSRRPVFPWGQGLNHFVWILEAAEALRPKQATLPPRIKHLPPVRSFVPPKAPKKL